MSNWIQLLKISSQSTANPLTEHLPQTIRSLRNIVLQLFSSCPDSFVSTHLWKTHYDLLHHILTPSAVAEFLHLSRHAFSYPAAIKEANSLIRDMTSRNNAISFRVLPERKAVAFRSNMQNLEVRYFQSLKFYQLRSS